MFDSPRARQALSSKCFGVYGTLANRRKSLCSPLTAAVEAFLLTKRVSGYTGETLRCYDGWLRRFIAGVPEASPLTVRTFFAGLQHLSASRQQQAYRTLRTFFR